MVALTVLMVSISLLLFVPVIMGYRRHENLHHVDAMAGDEGE